MTIEEAMHAIKHKLKIVFDIPRSYPMKTTLTDAKGIRSTELFDVLVEDLIRDKICTIQSVDALFPTDCFIVSNGSKYFLISESIRYAKLAICEFCGSDEIQKGVCKNCGCETSI